MFRSSLFADTIAMASSEQAGEDLPEAKSESTKLEMLESVGSSSLVEVACFEVNANTGWEELLAETQAAAAISDASARFDLMLPMLSKGWRQMVSKWRGREPYAGGSCSHACKGAAIGSAPNQRKNSRYVSTRK